MKQIHPSTQSGKALLTRCSPPERSTEKSRESGAWQ
jgi:hypothetical protein